MHCITVKQIYPHTAHPLQLIPLLISTSTGQQLTLSFTQVDFNEEEGTGSVVVRVRKEGTNVGDLVVTVTPLTYDEFDAMNFTLPPEIPRNNLPDPAECKYLEPDCVAFEHHG